MEKLTKELILSTAERSRISGKMIRLGDAGQKSLCLLITPRGSMSWCLRCRDHMGVLKTFTLGGYPGLTLRNARLMALSLREKVRAGYNPIEEKRDKRKELAVKDASHTLRTLVELYGRQG